MFLGLSVGHTGKPCQNDWTDQRCRLGPEESSSEEFFSVFVPIYGLWVILQFKAIEPYHDFSRKLQQSWAIWRNFSPDW